MIAVTALPGRAEACRTPVPAPAYSMEILVDGTPLTAYNARGTTYIEARKGAEYAIRLTNRTGDRVAVALAVDGLNSIDAKHTSSRDARKWILAPWESVTLSGWQTSSGTARRFVKRSNIGHAGLTHQGGEITVRCRGKKERRNDCAKQHRGTSSDWVQHDFISNDRRFAPLRGGDRLHIRGNLLGQTLAEFYRHRARLTVVEIGRSLGDVQRQFHLLDGILIRAVSERLLCTRPTSRAQALVVVLRPEADLALQVAERLAALWRTERAAAGRLVQHFGNRGFPKLFFNQPNRLVQYVIDNM
jgi:hypothetical protein